MPALEVAVDWASDANVTDRLRRKVNRLVRKLAPVLNEYEAALYDMSNLASNGYEYLAPTLEVSLPVQEESETFRLRMMRAETTRMLVVTKTGDEVAEIHLQ